MRKLNRDCMAVIMHLEEAYNLASNMKNDICQDVAKRLEEAHDEMQKVMIEWGME